MLADTVLLKMKKTFGHSSTRTEKGGKSHVHRSYSVQPKKKHMKPKPMKSK